MVTEFPPQILRSPFALTIGAVGDAHSECCTFSMICSLPVSFFFFLLLFTSLEGEFQRVKLNKHKKHGELRTSCACAKYGILQASLFSSPHQTPPSPPPTTALNPDARPLSRYKTKMAVRTGKCSILMILRENRELRTVYFCLVLFLLDLLCVASRFLT